MCNLNVSKTFLVFLFFIANYLLFTSDSYSQKTKFPEEISEKPAPGLEISLKKSPSNKIAEVKNTDKDGECEFVNVAKGEYNLSFLNYNSTIIDSLLGKFSLTRKNIKTINFKIKVKVNGVLTQYEVVEKTAAQLTQKTSNIYFSSSLRNTDEKGTIRINVLMDIEIGPKK
jgi:hypothetical protein